MQSERMHHGAGITEEAIQAADRIYKLWDKALGAKDADAAADLYAPDSVFESPLVRHLAKAPDGMIQGREKLRQFLRMVFDRTPPIRLRHRTGYFTDGRTLIWEYPRATPTGEQMDFVEVMEIENGLIHRHRVYWGWLGLKVLEQDRYWNR